MICDRIDQFHLQTIDMKESQASDPVFASILTNESSGSRTIFSYTPQGPKTANADAGESQYDIALFDGFYIESAIAKARKCKAHGITTVMDGGSWKKGTEKLLPFIDIAICSQDFIPPGIVHQEEITDYLLKKGVKKAAITRGEKAIIANEGEVNMLVEVPKVEVIDTLGAGDIFHGAFCYFYAHNQDFQESLKKAADVAANSCRYRGPRTWMTQA